MHENESGGSICNLDYGNVARLFPFDNALFKYSFLDLRIFSQINWSTLQVFVEHEEVISCVAVTGSNRHVVSGSHDCKLLVWGLWTGAVEHQLTGHTGQVTCVKLTNDGSIAVSGTYTRNRSATQV